MIFVEENREWKKKNTKNGLAKNMLHYSQKKDILKKEHQCVSVLVRRITQVFDPELPKVHCANTFLIDHRLLKRFMHKNMADLKLKQINPCDGLTKVFFSQTTFTLKITNEHLTASSDCLVLNIKI